MDRVQHSRRQFAAALGGGLALPGLVQARPRHVDADNLPIVAAVAPRALSPGETIETSDDPYRRMTAPIYINGQGPFFFVVDTGANQSVVSSELAAQLALPTGETVQLHGVAGVETTPTVIARMVKVGSRVERDVQMPMLPEGSIGAPGIIGIDRLSKQRVTMDFHARQLVVEPSGSMELTAFMSRVPARHRSGQLTIVDASLAGIPVSAFLDSGAERTIGNPALYELAVLKVQQGAFFDVPIISVTGRTLQGHLAQLPVLRLGHVRLLNIAVTFADLHVFKIWGLEKPTVLLGMDALSTFDSVTLDFAKAEVVFELVPGRHRTDGRSPSAPRP